MLNLIEASNKVLQLFQNDETRNLNEVAAKASDFARRGQHREAARLRRVARWAIGKSDPTLNLLLWRVFAIICTIAIAGILTMIKLK